MSTVIVAYTDHQNGITAVGGDSMISMDNNSFALLPTTAPKVFTSGLFIFGSAGNMKIRNVLRAVDFRDVALNKSFVLEDILMQKIIPSMMTTIENLGYLGSGENRPRAFEGEILVAAGSQICVISGGFTVLPMRAYWAIGSGSQVALGALALARRIDLSACDAVRYALEAAEKHINTVAGPFTILETTPI